MSRQVVCLTGVLIVLGLVFAVTGCGGGAQVIPEERQPVGEAPETGPEDGPEESTEMTPVEEQPAEEPVEGETEGERLAKEELAAAMTKAKELAGENKFDEALAELSAVITKYEGSPILADAQALVAELDAGKKEGEQEQFLTAAQTAYTDSVERCDKKVQEKQFREALKILDSFPAKFIDTEFKAKIDAKAKEVEILQERWQLYQVRLVEAKERHRGAVQKADALAGENKFDDALKELESYSGEYSDLEGAPVVDDLRAQIEAARDEYEEEQRQKADAQMECDRRIAQARGLATEKRFDEGIELLEGFPPEYERFGHGPTLQDVIDEIAKAKADYEEEQFQKAASERYDDVVARANTLAGENKFDEALAVLTEYPEEYVRTQWPEQIAAKQAQVEADKAAYEEHQRLIKEAVQKAQEAIGKAGELAGKSEFDEALNVLRSYPAKYRETDSQVLVQTEIEKIEGQQKEYQKRQTTMGIVIAIVIVVLLVVVIAISAKKKGKRGSTAPAPMAAYEPEEVVDDLEEVEPEEISPPEEKPEGGESAGE